MRLIAALHVIKKWKSLFQTSLVCFGTFVLADENNVLTAQNTFVSLAYFNIITIPLNFVPMLIMQCAQVSLKAKYCLITGGELLREQAVWFSFDTESNAYAYAFRVKHCVCFRVWCPYEESQSFCCWKTSQPRKKRRYFPMVSARRPHRSTCMQLHVLCLLLLM